MSFPLIQSSRTNCRCPGSPIRRACLEEVASNFLKTEILHRYLQNPSPSNWSLSGKFKDSHKNGPQLRSEEHTSGLQSLMRISYAVFCLKIKKNTTFKNKYDD